MACDGAGLVGGSSSALTIKQVKLERESKLRIQVGNDAPLRLRLLNGTAENFGTELPPEIWLNFPPSLKFVVFTWYGATIEMDGATETDYTADEVSQCNRPIACILSVKHIGKTKKNRGSDEEIATF
ncbi:hypothetical protein JHK86_042862 [Glycine max]|nr:hypothetical protein JHK86_042862 [Glycine max]